MEPILHLSPGEIRDRSGDVDPSRYTIHSSVQVLDGPYGPYYDLSGATVANSVSMAVAQIPGLRGNRGSLLIRAKIVPPPAAQVITLGSSGSAMFTITGSASLPAITYSYRTSAGSSTDLNVNQTNDWSWFAIRWDGANATFEGRNGRQDRTNMHQGGAFGGNMSLGYGAGRNVSVSDVLIYDQYLRDDQLQAIVDMKEPWSWNNLSLALWALDPGDTTSGLYEYGDEVFITDRNSTFMTSITDKVVEVEPDWDIDRSASKGNVAITAISGVLESNMWIAPFRTIYPEIGSPIRYQRGHFRLGRPSHRFDGAAQMDTGEPLYIQEASGGDIVDVLASARLRETFTTPKGALVMSDCRVLAKMATAGRMGGNILPNGSFEVNTSGWVNESYAGVTAIREHAPEGGANWEATDGSYALSFQIPSNLGVTAHGSYSCTVNVVSGRTRYYVSGFARWGSSAANEVNSRIRVRFLSGGGSPVVIGDFTPNYTIHPIHTWIRHFYVFDIPPGTEQLEVTITSYRNSAPGAIVWGHWDDIRLGTASLMPLPDSRIALPYSGFTAQQRIQTIRGQSIGLDAINGDRLQPMNYYDLFTDQSGALTSRKIEEASALQPKRIFGPGYAEIAADPAEIPMQDGDIPNHFSAVKEDPEDADNSLYAEAWNDDANDRFSIVNADINSAPQISIPDAADMAELQAAVNAEKIKHARQDQVTFSIPLDPILSIYDAVQFIDPDMPALNGNWTIQSIGYDGPRMNITARRASVTR